MKCYEKTVAGRKEIYLKMDCTVRSMVLGVERRETWLVGE